MYRTILFFTLALYAIPSFVNAASIKCWINENDVRECGSVIPPQYSKRDHEVRDGQGDVVETIQAEKSPEERHAILEKMRQEEEAKRLAEQQEKQDRALLDAYPTASDILIACNGKAASVDAAIQVAQNQVDFYNKSLADAEELRDRTQNPSKDLLNHIKNLKRQKSNFEQTIHTKLQEKEKIKQEHQQALYRYQDVKYRLKKERGAGAIRIQQRVQEGTNNTCELNFKQFEDAEESVDGENEGGDREW